MTMYGFCSSGLRPRPSSGAAVRNVSKGFRWMTIRNRKNASTTAITATTYGMSSRCRWRFVATAMAPKTDSRKTQKRIDPSRPPQYDVIL